MLKLRNKTRGASKVGYLVKVVRGGFEYAGYGDTPIGVVTEVCPAGRFCKIQTEGRALVYVGKTVKEGQQIRMKNEDEKLPAGQTVPVTGDEDSFTSIGYTIGKGRGVVEVSLNIGSAAGGAGGGGGIEEAPLTGSQYARQSGAWSIVSSGISDAVADSIAYSRYNNGWVNSNLIIDRSGGAGAQTAVVNYDERLTIVGDGTFISSTYTTYVNAFSQTIHQIALSLAPGALDTEWYLASADGQQGTPRTVYDSKAVRNDSVVVFLEGQYTTLTQNVNTNTSFYSPSFGIAVNELTIDIDQVALDGRYYTETEIDGFNFVTAGPNDGYDYAWEGSGWSRNMLTIKYNGGTSTDYLNVGDNTNSDTIEFLASGDLTVSYAPGSAPGAAKTVTFGHTPTPVYTDWKMYMNGAQQASITSGYYADWSEGTGGGISLSYSELGSPPVHSIAIDVDQTWLDNFIDAYGFLISGPNDGYDYLFSGTGWSRAYLKMLYNGGTSTDYINLGNNTSSDSIEFLASGDLTVSYNPTTNKITYGHTPTAVYTDWNLYVDGVKEKDITSGAYMNFAAGTGISLAFTDPGSPPLNTVTITNSSPGYWTLSGSDVYRSAGYIGVGTSVIPNQVSVENSVSGTFSGKGIIGDDIGNSGIKFYDQNVGNMHIFNKQNSAAYGSIYLSTGPFTTPIPRVTVYYNGNVGIGTTAPITTLEVKASDTTPFTVSNTDFVNGSVGSSFHAYFGATTGNTYVDLRALTTGRSAWGDMILQGGGGKVGIGTTAPNARFHINNNIAYSMSSLATAINSGMGFRMTGRSSATGTLTIGSTSVDDYAIQVVNDAGTVGYDLSLNPFGGNVGIGDTTPSYKLDVNGTARVAGSFYPNGITYHGSNIYKSDNTSGLLIFGGSGTGGNIELYGGSHASLANRIYYDASIHTFRDYDGAPTTMIITSGSGVDVTGYVRASGEVESYDTSDINLKENIERLDYKFIAKEMLSSSLISYDHKLKNKREVGWIAQEIEMFLPENIKRDGNDNLMIHYGKMGVALSAVDRYQQDQIEELQSEVKELKLKLSKY